MKRLIFLMLLGSTMLFAQQRQPAPGAGQSRPRTPAPGGLMQPSMAPDGPHGLMRRSSPKWWKNSELMRQIGVTSAQVQKIEQIFQEQRMKLIDLRAALEKEEATLEPLVEADEPNEAQVLAQIDRVSAARAGLERANAQMMLSIRRSLTREQWQKLKEITPPSPALAPVAPGAPPPQMRMPAPPPSPEDDEVEL